MRVHSEKADRNKAEDRLEMERRKAFSELQSVSTTLWQEIIEAVSMGIFHRSLG